MCLIASENADFGRHKPQFLNGVFDMLVLGRPLDVGVELSSDEASADLIALKLCQVYSVRGEPAESLVKGGGNVPHAAYD